ncbi:MAG: BadF/BadG/BcrA/BcrD ATPase family protein, partial [Clostridium sp.]|nr:BadF/BadG/BcrA/BcrD ATPase family protein [Clostridium sp.]
MNKLGIDVGYSTFKYIYLNSEDELIDSGYVFHRGNIQKHYQKLIKKIKEENNDEKIILGITGNLSERLSLGKKYHVNNNIAAVEGALYRNNNAKSVIELGAQETKYFMNISSAHMKFFKNTSCSSGSGSFIEEQALRLSIDIEKISDYIEKAKSVPRIAGRCSVFSKTDMIHHMQDGETIEDILNGLCYALVRNFRGNVIQKNKIETPVMLIGGVMKNKGVVNALKEILKLNDDDIICDEYCELVTCFGACKMAEEKNFIIDIKELLDTHEEIIVSKREAKFKCLNEFGNDDSS